MSQKLTREAYRRLVREDLEWLWQQPDTLERHHIEMILRDSEEHYYPVPPEPKNGKAGH